MKTDDITPPTSNNGIQLAIIGIGCLFPKASDQQAYWANIMDGVDAITEVPPTHWPIEEYYDQDLKSPDRTYGRRGGFISPVDFNPMEFNIPPNVLEAIDTSQLLGLVAAGAALKDAGYGPERSFDKSRASVILGVTGTLELVIPLGARLGHPIWRAALKDAGVDDTVAMDVVERISEAYVPWQENSFPGLLGNVVAGRISKQYDLGGTNCVVDAACASSLGALHLAALELASGKSDLVVTGGIDTFNDIFMYMCFSKTPALSPTGDAKPFDATADGTILGEGLGLVVLKRLADAERDGDQIYAVIRGIGSSSDGKGDAIYAPSAAGQVKALRNAYENAGVTPESIGVIEAHGTGTKVGDAVEISALREVFGEAPLPWCSLGSVKSQIGHAKAAAGAAGLIKAALALHHKVIPPTIKVQHPQKDITSGPTPFYITSQKRPWFSPARAPRRAGVSAFGFGGSNFHVVLEEYQPSKKGIDWDGFVQIVLFSGSDACELTAGLDRIPVDGSWNAFREMAQASRGLFDPKAPCRLALVVEQGKTNLPTLLRNARETLEKKPQSPWQTPDGAFFACGGQPGKLAMLFPGQGSQYTGMLNDLACRFPQLMESIAQGNDGFCSRDGKLLSDLIYPVSPFDESTKTSQDQALRATQTAQPALGATSIGAWRLLQSFGVTPTAVAGHSYGELTALCAAGTINESALHTLSRLRGQLMGDETREKGGMLAVSAPLLKIGEVIVQEELDLVLANRNAPSQGVLSGAQAEIKRAAGLFSARGLTCKELPVTQAFHSPLVADAAIPFRALLDQIEMQAPQVPVYANATAEIYPADPVKAREQLAAQLSLPVEFAAMIEAMYAAGVTSFLEVGPGNRLTGLVQAILGNRAHLALALDASQGKRSGVADLGRALAQLAVTGHDVQLSAWDPRTGPAVVTLKKPAMTIPICGANYRKPQQKKPPVPAKEAVFAPSRPTPLSPQPQQLPQTVPLSSSASKAALSDSLKLTRDTLAFLQKMQEDTAALHRLFLEGEERQAKSIQTLLEQQQQMLAGVTLMPAASPPPVVVNAEVSTKERKIPTATAPAAALPTGLERISAALLDVVSEKTGYPLEMLEMDMGMDSDLGIDSIKRVEILAALKERLPESPAIGPEQLGELLTLGEIARHLLGAATNSATPGVRPLLLPSAGQKEALIRQALLTVVSEKTGYPIEMLEMDMGMDSDLGIDSIKRVEILASLKEHLPETPSIGAEQLGELRTLGEIVLHLLGETASLEPPKASAQAERAAQGIDIPSLLLEVVSEKTGYPAEMLALDMAMDSDLGIDSIKRVEILSTLQERLPGTAAIGAEHLATLSTLGDIARHLTMGLSPTDVTVSPSAPQRAVPELEAMLLAVVSEKTGYPVELLQLDMEMDSDLGIDSIKRVEILATLKERAPATRVIGPEELGTLRTLHDIARYLAGSTSEADVPVGVQGKLPSPGVAAIPLPAIERSGIVTLPLDTVDAPEAVPLALDGEVWVTDDGSPFTAKFCSILLDHGHTTRLVDLGSQQLSSPTGKLSGLVILAPTAGTDDLFLKNAFLLLKNAGPALRREGMDGGAVCVTVSRLDGAFGFGNGTTLKDPLSGGLAGLTKCAALEWPEVRCKAIDLGDFPDPQTAASAVALELLQAGPVEVGLTPNGRSTLSLAPLPQSQATAKAPLKAGEVVVVTGGGRGVTAAAALAMAHEFRPLLVLLGRSPEPLEEPAWLGALREESEIKRAIMREAVGKLHPKEIEERFRAVVASRELRSTLASITAAGGQAIYRAVDIRDLSAMELLLGEIRRAHGEVRGIIHGAGVLADRLILDKSAEQFEQVYSTKVSGLSSLLNATRNDQLRFIALFSSSTGRFGRVGQVDYAVANEVLNKMAQVEARQRTGCRVVSINWGPWDGGMVTPPLRKLFTSEGIGVIPLAEGGAFLAREIAALDAPVEIVALAGLSASKATVLPVREPVLSEAFALTLTISDYPFLRSHVLDGKAVLPMAVIVEWLAHGALHGNPGFRFHGFNDLRICKGVVFEDNTSFTLNVMAGRAVKRESFHLVPVELSSHGNNGQTLLHARAEIVLATRLPEGIRSITELPSTPYTPQNGLIYNRERLFHGPDLHGIEQVDGCSAKGIAATVKGAPLPASWIKQPLRSAWLTDPLVIDSAFQMMILWSFERFGSGSLPCFAGRYRQFQEAFPREGVQVVIRVTSESAHGASADMEFLDRHTGKLVARLEDYECVIDPSLKQAFQRNQLKLAVAVELGAA